MSWLDKVKSAKTARPRRTVIYGGHGVGKSTWASKWPAPVFLPIEDGIGDIDVPAFPVAANLMEAWGPLIELTGEQKHEFRTVVIDSADWLEKLIWEKVVSDQANDKIKHVSDIGYGKGYAVAAGVLGKYLHALTKCYQRGMHVVVIAHSSVVRFESPEGDSYDRFAPKLHKEAAALLQEWADEVLFACYKTYTSERDEGFGRKRMIGTGTGERILRTSEMPSHLAKNRLGLPSEISMEWDEYAEFLSQNKGE